MIFIVKGLQAMRNEREKTESEVESLEAEKKAITYLLPIIMHELRTMKDNIDGKYRDLRTYDNAIAEIEATYGHILYSPDIFNNASTSKSGGN